MSKHAKSALTRGARGRRSPVMPLMGGFALAGGAAMLLAGTGGTSAVASLSSTIAEPQALEYNLVNTEFSTDVLCLGQANCNLVGLASAAPSFIGTGTTFASI